jgi:hypothetical protein
MTEEEKQVLTERQGTPRNEEFNPRKGEDNYQLHFLNGKIQLDNAMANSQNVTSLATLALNETIALQQKLNALTLSWMDSREKK